jgi:hypothetical protein
MSGDDGTGHTPADEAETHTRRHADDNAGDDPSEHGALLQTAATRALRVPAVIP